MTITILYFVFVWMLDFLLKILGRSYTICDFGVASSNISLCLKTSFTSNCFVLLIIVLYAITTLYSIGYLIFERDKHKVKFHIFTALAVFTCIGLAYSGNLFTAFIFYELLSVFTYALVRHHRDKDSEEHAFVYAMYLILPSTLFLLPAITAIYYFAQNTNFVVGGIISSVPLSKLCVNILFLLFMYGISKTAIYPLHKWLIHAMVAPSPVSALLHAVLVVKGGLFFLYKVVYEIFGLEFLRENIYTFHGIYWPVFVSCIGIIVAGISAISSNNIKQRLAYSTISQISYISMCLFCFTEESLFGAKIQFVAHSFAKISLFYYAGYLLARYHCANVNELKFHRNHLNVFLSAMFLIPCISLMSFPLTIGFVGKTAILKGTLISPRDIVILGTIAFGAIICVFYLFPIICHLLHFNNSSHFTGQYFSTFCVYFSATIIAIFIILGFFCFSKIV